MRVFFVATVVTLLLCGAVGSSGVMRAAQDVLPDAPGKDITVKVSANCHAAETVASVCGTRQTGGATYYKKIEARKELLACM